MIEMAYQRKHRHTSELLGLVKYRHVVFFLLSAVFLPLHYRSERGLLSLKRSDQIIFNVDSLVLIFFLFPPRLFWWYSIAVSLTPFKVNQYKLLLRSRNFGRFILCLVTRGNNVESVYRGVYAMRNHKKLHKRIELHVLTEEATVHSFDRLREDTGVILHGVPKEFTPLKAKFKARALEWFRVNQMLQDNDWVLHLDEETYVDEHAVKACLDVIERSPDTSVAQGLILYNFHNYWGNWLTAWADNVRVTDDFGRFQWQCNHYRRPVFGMHGSFLLVRGEVENAVTWETDNMAEDYWFALHADRLGYRFGWIPAVAREQSPATLKDLVAQRRRWSYGVWTIGHRFATLSVVLWTWQSIEPLLWASIFFLDFPKLIPSWLYLFLCLEMSVSLSALSLSLWIQEYDAYIPWWQMLWHLLLIPFLTPLIGIVNSLPALIGVVCPPKKFYIIRK